MADVGHRLRHGHQPAVGGDDGHLVAGVEGVAERPRDARVQDAEAVLAPLHLHHRPRTTVDGDHVAVHARIVVQREQQLTVALEHHVAQDQRHVVLALGQRQALVFGVGHVVLRQQPVVDVFGRVVHAVVVVPEGARPLEVRVHVVLVLPRPGDIAGVAVERRQRCRTVQVHRGPLLVAQCLVHGGQVVEEPSHDRAALGGLDGRPRHRAVVRVHLGLEARDDLLGDLGHPDLVVVGLGVGSIRHCNRRHGERRRERLGQLAGSHASGDHRAGTDRALRRQCHGCSGEHARLDDIAPIQRRKSLADPSPTRRGVAEVVNSVLLHDCRPFRIPRARHEIDPPDDN